MFALRDVMRGVAFMFSKYTYGDFPFPLKFTLLIEREFEDQGNYVIKAIVHQTQ